MNPPSTATVKRGARAPTQHTTPRVNHSGLAAAKRQTATGHPNKRAKQHLTIVLDGISASDYLAWVRDPDPPTLGRDLHSIDARADHLGDRIELLLHWYTDLPAPSAAAPAAGFPLTPEVTDLRTGHR
jgi:hypothetical protein